MSGFFLISLEQVTAFRIFHPWLLYFLPLAGVVLVAVYHFYGKGSEGGNSLLIDSVHDAQKIIPFRMAPLVFLGTLATHLFGGSAGREGTAVQMAGALAARMCSFLKLEKDQRRFLLMAGLSAGFASVFGTPLAGAIFGLEVLNVGLLRYEALLTCFLSAFTAHFVCLAVGAHHSAYPLLAAPAFDATALVWSLLAGIFFGLVARFFSGLSHFVAGCFQRWIRLPYLRPLVGGGIFILIVLFLQTDRYLGLGVPVILESFEKLTRPADFFWKSLLTALILGSGFKGGEVTPLFFVGATCGNALSRFIPLPFPLLSGMGFVAVFAGAANTPLTCLLLGIELFGHQSASFMAIACVMSYLFSGHAGIYRTQRLGTPKDHA